LVGPRSFCPNFKEEWSPVWLKLERKIGGSDQLKKRGCLMVYARVNNDA